MGHGTNPPQIQTMPSVGYIHRLNITMTSHERRSAQNRGNSTVCLTVCKAKTKMTSKLRITSDWWIPLTLGQLCRKRFQALTSSCDPETQYSISLVALLPGKFHGCGGYGKLHYFFYAASPYRTAQDLVVSLKHRTLNIIATKSNDE